MSRPRLLVSLAALGLALGGCLLGEAEHENPLDPQSERYRGEGAVEGRVTGIYPPFDGRPGVMLRLDPVGADAPGRTAVTRDDGTFEIRDVPKGTYALHAEAAGLSGRTDTVTVETSGTVAVELPLDALPVVVEQALRTVHIERWFPDAPLFRLEVEVEVTDPDRATDVDAVALVVDALGFRAPLTEAGPGRYAATLDAAELPGGQVQSLLGRQHRIEVTDVTGNVGLGPPLALVRVIEQTPQTARPQSLEVLTSNPPTLEWRPTDLPFAFTYDVEVFLVDGAGRPNLVESAEGIPPTVTTYAVREPLPAGDYFWTVWLVDGAGNRSRSKEAGFRAP